MEYKSTIKSRPYLYKETKKASSLINRGLSVEEIKEKSLEDNIFQLESEARKREVASIITARLKKLDEHIIYSIENSNIEDVKPQPGDDANILMFVIIAIVSIFAAMYFGKRVHER